MKQRNSNNNNSSNSSSNIIPSRELHPFQELIGVISPNSTKSIRHSTSFSDLEPGSPTYGEFPTPPRSRSPVRRKKRSSMLGKQQHRKQRSLKQGVGQNELYPNLSDGSSPERANELLDQASGIVERINKAVEIQEKLKDCDKQTTKLEFRVVEIQDKIEELNRKKEELGRELQDIENQRQNLLDSDDYFDEKTLSAIKSDLKSKFIATKEEPGKATFEKSMLECVVCLEIPPASVYSCQTCDNIICDRCNNKELKHCPACRKDFGNGQTPKRNRMAERIIQSMKKNNR